MARAGTSCGVAPHALARTVESFARASPPRCATPAALTPRPPHPRLPRLPRPRRPASTRRRPAARLAQGCHRRLGGGGSKRLPRRCPTLSRTSRRRGSRTPCAAGRRRVLAGARQPPHRAHLRRRHAAGGDARHRCADEPADVGGARLVFAARPRAAVAREPARRQADGDRVRDGLSRRLHPGGPRHPPNQLPDPTRTARAPLTALLTIHRSTSACCRGATAASRRRTPSSRSSTPARRRRASELAERQT